MKLTKREKKVLGWLAYSLFLLTICEVALRVYLIHFADTQRFQIYASRSMIEKRFIKPVVMPHFYLGYENTPNYNNGVNVHNSLGFRGKEILKDKPDSTFRIVCIGGSTTYSTGVDDYEHSYPFLLEKKLNESGVHVEVINAGVRGYNSLQSYINYLTKIEDLNPDMLLVYHAVNDIWTRAVWPPEAYKADQSGSYTVQSSPEYKGISSLSIIRVPLIFAGVISPETSWNNVVKIPESNHSVALEKQLRNNTYPSGIFDTIPVDMMLKVNKPIFFHRNLKMLVEVARSNGTQVVFSTFTYSKTHPSYVTELKLEAFQECILEHNDIIRDLSKDNGVPLLDLEKELSLEDEWLTDGMHFNFLGNQIRAEKISELLLPLIDK